MWRLEEEEEEKNTEKKKNTNGNLIRGSAILFIIQFHLIWFHTKQS